MNFEVIKVTLLRVTPYRATLSLVIFLLGKVQNKEAKFWSLYNRSTTMTLLLHLNQINCGQSLIILFPC